MLKQAGHLGLKFLSATEGADHAPLVLVKAGGGLEGQAQSLGDDLRSLGDLGSSLATTAARS
jgi:triacylglycerol esterase/lipase EstA (alpha/beta hydrolase family)